MKQGIKGDKGQRKREKVKQGFVIDKERKGESESRVLKGDKDGEKKKDRRE